MNAATKLTPEVRSILEASTCSGPKLVLPPRLERATYVRVDKVLGMMGGAWNRRLKAHVFDGDAEEAVADALTTGSVVDLRKLFQFFPTPSELAARLVELADVPPNGRVLEPSAGDGAIAAAARKLARVEVCEIQERFHAKLQALGCLVVGTDFLQLAPRHPGYDAVIANPPFTRGQDIEHVRRMLQHVKPDGKVVSIMSPAWRFRETHAHRAFRDLVVSRGGEWTDLPPSSFAASGTEVNTGILVLRGQA